MVDFCFLRGHTFSIVDKISVIFDIFFPENHEQWLTQYIGISGNLLLSALKNPARQYLAMVYIGNSEA